MARKKVDWIKVRSEYLTTSISQRKLSEKYNIPWTTLRDRANKEKWNTQRKEKRETIRQKTEKIIEDKIVEFNVDRITRILNLSDKLADKIEQAIDELDSIVLRNRVKKREVEYKDETAIGKPTKEVIEENERIQIVKANIDRLGLQQVASALKSIKEINTAFSNNDDDKYDDDGLLDALMGCVDDMDDDSDFLERLEE